MAPEAGGDREDGQAERRPAPRQPNWGIAFDLGIRLGISVILGLGGGLALDAWLHTSPIFTLIGMVLGIGAAMYTIWDVARDAMRR
jgi:F0F1-type ATP synthase assembly protein I